MSTVKHIYDICRTGCSGMQVTRGVMYTQQEAEGKRLRNPFDTITEGIGINRQTQNFSKAHIDGAFQGTDREAVEMVTCVTALCAG